MISKLEKLSSNGDGLSCHDISLLYEKSLVIPNGNDINEEQSKETKQTYTDSAVLYSMIEWSKKLTYKTWRETRRPFLRELILNKLENDEIVFAGCGSGRDAKWVSSFLKRIGKKPNITGIDYSPSMIEIARKNLDGDIALRIQDITALEDISTESVGSIFCESAITHLSVTNINKVLSSFYRILKPGGIIFIGFRNMENENMSNVYTTTNDIGNRHYLRMDSEKQEKILIDIGFKIVWKNSSNHIDTKRPPFTNYIVKK